MGTGHGNSLSIGGPHGDPLGRLRAIASALPDDGSVSLSRASLLAMLASADTDNANEHREVDRPFWPDRLWSLHESTLLNTDEAAAALGRSRDWLYRHLATSKRAVPDPIPAVRMGGELRVQAGALRDWINRNTEQAA